MNRDYDDFLNILRKHGWSGSDNESDFYFQNRSTLDLRLYGPAVSSDEWAMRVRWKSEIGIECVKAIRKYIANKISAHDEATRLELTARHSVIMNDPNWQQKITATPRDFYATIDFNDFGFEFNGRSWSLNEFVYLFPTHRLGTQMDLTGIDLSEIKFFNTRLLNLCFVDANFENAIFNQVQLVNTTFVRSNFRNASLESVRILEGTRFDRADMIGAGLYGLLYLNDDTLTQPFEYREISYFYLVLSALQSFGYALFRKKPKRLFGREKGKHTAFANNQTKDMTLPETRPLREYVKWYQHTMQRIVDLPRASALSRLAFLISVICTKHWTSYGALACSALVLNLMFTAVYAVMHSHYCGMPSNLMGVFYSSVLIFTTLGVEGIKPCTAVTESIVITEAVSGYVMLGLFVYLLTRKIERQF